MMSLKIAQRFTPIEPSEDSSPVESKFPQPDPTAFQNTHLDFERSRLLQPFRSYVFGDSPEAHFDLIERRKADGTYELLMISADPAGRKHPAVVVAGDRAAPAAIDEFGYGQPLLDDMRRAFLALNHPVNRLPAAQSGGFNLGNVGDGIAGVVGSIIPLAALPFTTLEGLFRSGASLIGHLWAVAEVAFVQLGFDIDPRGRSNLINFERRAQFEQSTTVADSVRALQSVVANWSGADVNSLAYQIGAVIGPFLIAKQVKKGGGPPRPEAARLPRALDTNKVAQINANIHKATHNEVVDAAQRMTPAFIARLRTHPDTAATYNALVARLQHFAATSSRAQGALLRLTQATAGQAGGSAIVPFNTQVPLVAQSPGDPQSPPVFPSVSPIHKFSTKLWEQEFDFEVVGREVVVRDKQNNRMELVRERPSEQPITDDEAKDLFVAAVVKGLVPWIRLREETLTLGPSVQVRIMGDGNGPYAAMTQEGKAFIVAGATSRQQANADVWSLYVKGRLEEDYGLTPPQQQVPPNPPPDFVREPRLGQPSTDWALEQLKQSLEAYSRFNWVEVLAVYPEGGPVPGGFFKVFNALQRFVPHGPDPSDAQFLLRTDPRAFRALADLVDSNLKVVLDPQLGLANRPGVLWDTNGSHGLSLNEFYARIESLETAERQSLINELAKLVKSVYSTPEREGDFRVGDFVRSPINIGGQRIVNLTHVYDHNGAMVQKDEYGNHNTLIPKVELPPPEWGNVIVVRSHGWQRGVGGEFGNSATADAIVSEIQRLQAEGRSFDRIVLSACSQRDPRTFGLGWSNGWHMQQIINRKLDGLGLKRVDVYIADQPGQTYTPSLETAYVQVDGQRIPIKFVPPDPPSGRERLVAVTNTAKKVGLGGGIIGLTAVTVDWVLRRVGDRPPEKEQE